MPRVVEVTRAREAGPLKLALPRGALWVETLDALDRIDVDTSELRSDSRSLVFESGGLTLVTMRPSDVPTYVEAGAADLGLTGKDGVVEQRGRVVFEVAQLRDGGCPIGPARRGGDTALDEDE